MYAVIKLTDKIVRNVKFPYKKEIISQQEIVEILEDGNEAFRKALKITNDHLTDCPPYINRIYGLSIKCNSKENKNNTEETNEEEINKNEKIIFPYTDSDIENTFKTLTENNNSYNNSPVIVKRFVKEEFFLSMKWAWDKYTSYSPTASKSFSHSNISYMRIVVVLFNLAQNVYTSEINTNCDNWVFSIEPRYEQGE